MEPLGKPSPIYLTFKRLCDIVFAVVGLLLTSPLWLLAIIGIEISDPGPIFYFAQRVGRDHRVFRMLKFRSMRKGQADETAFRGEEKRIFPFGKFMRSTKIDELPQLINILLGDMSLVGPRPAAVGQMAVTRGGQLGALGNVPGGLTGPSALYDYIYGDSIDDAREYEQLVLPTRLKLDLVYLRKQSLWFDLQMIWWTVLCIACAVVRHPPKKIYHQLLQWSNELGEI